MWNDLVSAHLTDSPWLICGDFNCILNPEDKYGGRDSSNSYSSTNLCNFIKVNGLVDLSFNVPLYT